MTRRSLAADLGVALLVLALSLAVLAAGGLGTASPEAVPLDGKGVALALAASLPLAGRRRAPLTAYLVVAVGTGLLLWQHYPLDFPFGCVLAVYTVAAAYGGDPRRALRWGTRVVVGAFVPVAATTYAAAGYWADGMLAGILFWALTFAGAWLAGDLSRVRRERLLELQERAERNDRETERERRLAAAEERTRIARELHDSAGHAINVILVQAGAARLLHERAPDRSLDAIRIIERVARGTIEEIDRLVHALRAGDADGTPEVPADPAALEELLDAHRADGLRIATDLRGTRVALPRSVAWAAYRILQESLTNAARHGEGSAAVTVAFSPAEVEISVSNPVRAVRAPAENPAGRSGHGIVGMRERATLLGGSLDVRVTDGTFRLRASLPYEEPVR
ncbi:sensor histidine kinase [Plantactinospora siamensis]|uniref:histidine kinase n=1 Tax=Plantactinospora siamensis TaxID=555372 RepID=A0ABV6P3I3_9ACTN